MLIPLVVAALLSQAKPPASQKPNPYLSQAKVFHQGLEYEKCLQRLTQAARWPSSQKEQVEIELYGGLCSYGAGKIDDAKERFGMALQLDPQIALPPFTSPKVMEVFATVKERLAPQEEVKTEPKVEAPKTEVAVADPPKREIAMPPPPAANLTPSTHALGPSKPRPWLDVGGKNAAVPVSIAVAGIAATGGAVYLGMMARNLEAQANASQFQVDALRIGGQAQTAALWSNVGYAVAGTALVTAVTVFLVSPVAE